MTARAQFEQACHAAIGKLRDDIEAGTYRPTADSKCVDQLLKAADRYAHGAAAMRRRDQVRARDLDAARAKAGAAL